MTPRMPLQTGVSVNFARAYRRVTDIILGNTSDSLTVVLREIPPLIGIQHIAYVHLGKDSNADVATLSAMSTYPKEWQVRYFSRGYAEIDPIFVACRRASSSFDWGSVPVLSAESKAFFADAASYGLGQNGFTIRVPSRNAGYGMVSFNSGLTDAEWETYKHLYMAKLEVIACLVDTAADRNVIVPSKKIELAKREQQALVWAARGKTASEIGEIMGVSYATARSHLEGARRKLNCENVTHAVATALASGLIPPMALRGSEPLGYLSKDEASEAAEA